MDNAEKLERAAELVGEVAIWYDEMDSAPRGLLDAVAAALRNTSNNLQTQSRLVQQTEDLLDSWDDPGRVNSPDDIRNRAGTIPLDAIEDEEDSDAE